jgi:hypothetical protein
MKPTDLRSLLAAAIANRLPILITGAPGIGKSDIVAKAAVDAGADLILSHPAVADPTDVKGLPWMQDGRATFLPFGELAEAIRATRPTVWFLDDLGQASPAVQASFMQLLLARRVNGHVLPDCVSFIAATNRRTDRAGVAGILEPVKSRFATIIELSADLVDWCDWAIGHGVPAEVIAFLRFRPDLLSAFVPTADLQNSPSPRTWSHAGKLLALDLPAALQAQAIAGAVGPTAGTEFSAFLQMYRELPSVDAILVDPTLPAIPDRPGTLYALCGALAYRATAANFARVAQFAERLLSNRKGEFGSLLVRDAIRRTPDLQHTAAYVRLSCGELGKLITGTV